MYPVMLNVQDRPVLVVGGGGVALRKIEGLLAAGARLTVVAPGTLAAIDELARRGEVELRKRAYESTDVAGFALVFAATDHREVNAQVFRDGRDANVWVNVSDDPDYCSFHLPARVQRGSLQLSIASDGGAPFVVRRLRQLLERRFGPEWSEWMEAAARFRTALRGLRLAAPVAERRQDAFFAATVDGEALRARVPSAAELERWLSRPADEPRGASELTAANLGNHLPALVSIPGGKDGRAATEAEPGLVSLVGGGPGDPGLLTVRARQRLLAADAVVYDRLAAAALPCDLPARVELHCVGKEAGHHSVPQEEINAILVRLALAGKRTVSFNGGEPFVFGRGSEEAETLRQLGIPYEVVPGVTAAIGATAYAGIPVTHRGESVRLTLVTAHESSKGDGPQVRWDMLARDPHSTLVGYMGVANLPEVSKRLLAAGMPPSTPAALIAQGTRAGQHPVVSTVSGLHAAGIAAGIRPPAIFVIGPTVRHAKTLDWFTSRPLHGQRIGVFAPAGALGAALELAGAEVLETPRPLSAAARVVIAAAPLTGWLFRNPHEVEALEEERGIAGWSAEMEAHCLGSAAVVRARALAWRHVIELAEGASAEAVVAAVAARSSIAASSGGKGVRRCR